MDQNVSCDPAIITHPLNYRKKKGGKKKKMGHPTKVANFNQNHLASFLIQFIEYWTKHCVGLLFLPRKRTRDG